jgi:hypothetical protein
MIIKAIKKYLEYNVKIGAFVFSASFTATLMDQLLGLNLLTPLLVQ